MINKIIICEVCGRYGNENDFWTWKRKFIFPLKHDINGFLKLNQLKKEYVGKCKYCMKGV